MIGHRLEAQEQAFLLGAGALVLVLLWTVPTWPLKLLGGAGVGVFTAWAALAPYKGRTWLRWREIRRTYRRALRGGDLLYVSRAPRAGRSSAGRLRPVPPPAGVPPLEWLTASTAFGEVAVLMQPTERVFTATLEVEADRDFGGLDEPERESLIVAFEHLLRSTAEASRIRRLAWMLRVVPTDPTAHARDSVARRDWDAPAWLRDSYDRLQQQVAISAEDRRLFVTLSVPYTQALVAEARAYSSLAEGFGRVVGAEVETFVRTLPLAQLRLVRTLDEATLASLIHSLYDPTHQIDDTVGANRQSAWPAEVDGRDPRFVKTRTWSNPDPWYSATAWFKELPVVSVRVNFLAPLLLWIDDAIRTVTVVMDLADSERALSRAMGDLSNEIGQADGGPVQNPKDKQARARAAQTVEELGEGYAGVTLTGWVTVSARGEKELAKAQDVVRGAIVKSRMRPEWCDREHWRAFANTLPLATGLLREW
ncbi:hypothetical protein BJF79_07460 [Actinomadura sp. CNU-125]|nr:hypothetical protein BJF79_07460 [Actinomadura sp. CNU-125]